MSLLFLRQTFFVALKYVRKNLIYFEIIVKNAGSTETLMLILSSIFILSTNFGDL